VLAIFALSLTAVLMAAALAFDVGDVLLERRDEQNAADAAAMAGARYVIDNEPTALVAARDIATKNGFTHGDTWQSVEVNIPPKSGPWKGFDNSIEVVIANTRPSIFAGVAGILNWQVSARAVAAQLDGVGGPWAFMALHETVCEAVKVTGNGNISAFGSLQVNSSCPDSALKRQGPGSITLSTTASCDVHGGIQDGGGSGELACVKNPGAGTIPDPLAGLPAPAVPALAQPPDQVPVVGEETLDVPDDCPATIASPGTCQFPSNYADTTWRMYPGLYPGGIKLQGGTFYLEPGIYYLGGGGLEITGNGTNTFSVDAGGEGSVPPAFPEPVDVNEMPPEMDLPGGVLFFNSESENSAIGPISLNGADANIYLAPLELEPLDPPQPNDPALFNGMVIYQDRIAIGGDDITINGSTSGGMAVRGTIYAPLGDVKVNGNDGQLTLDQVIASTFQVAGSPGSQILALNSEDYVILFYAAGLVE
jgi:hypothetical protein